MKKVLQGLAFFVIFFTVFAGSAAARGTPAGTVITNRATVSYRIGNAAFTQQTPQVRITVDQITDVVVTPVTTTPAPVNAGGTGYVAMRVTNTGNGPDGFALAASVAPGAQFTPGFPAANGFARDANGDGVYTPGVDPYVTTLANVPADGYATVFVFVSAPAGAADGQTAGIVLTATSQAASGAPGTLVAGGGVGGVNAMAGGNGGRGSNAASPAPVVVQSVSIRLVKSVQVISDPYTAAGGQPQPIQGAVLRYTITATAQGQAAAGNVVVTDPIPAGTNYRPGTLTLDGAALTDAKDADAGDYNATTPGAITVTLGAMKAGQPGGTHTITFDVVIP